MHLGAGALANLVTCLVRVRGASTSWLPTRSSSKTLSGEDRGTDGVHEVHIPQTLSRGAGTQSDR